MKFTKDQKRIAYKKLSEQTQSFIGDSDTLDNISVFLEKNNINNEKADLADSEILYAMYGLQTLSEAIENIARISGKSVGELSNLKDNLQKDVFDKIREIENRDSGNVQSEENPKLDKAIESRLSEITTKYSLNNEKSIILSAEIAKSINNPQLPKISVDTLIEMLDISSLIAEQVLNDLNNRIFNSSIKTAKTAEAVSSNQTNKPETTGSAKTDSQMTPGITTAQIPNYTPRPKVVLDNEPVQTPVSVPRFKAVPMEGSDNTPELIPTIKPKPSAGGIMESKINTVIDKTVEQKTTMPKYTVDPYREPLG